MCRWAGGHDLTLDSFVARVHAVGCVDLCTRRARPSGMGRGPREAVSYFYLSRIVVPEPIEQYYISFFISTKKKVLSFIISTVYAVI
jgi:hypothetical protein